MFLIWSHSLDSFPQFSLAATMLTQKSYEIANMARAFSTSQSTASTVGLRRW